MPVASLPGKQGCGTFGPEAYHFIDLCREGGLSIWQILPLNPLGFGNSPYQPYSSYAMDDLYISPDILKEEGLIREVPSYHAKDKQIHYDDVRRFREPYLKEAFHNFKPDLNYTEFSYQPWMKDYALFMTFKKANGMKQWTEWPEEMKNQPAEGKCDLKPYQDDILYEVFLQYELYRQWKKLKQYANDNGIEIMGDMPFYVGLDSADVWSNRSQFLLDKDGYPRFIAGVPPDYFSATGQRWGNPIYDWDAMKKDGFTFWINRLSYCGKSMDIVRVDHFRAFDTYWKIPASCPTAVEGKWVEAPGYELFDTLFEKNPDLRIVAEDLGDLRAQVLELRDHYAFRGMRVIQFTMDEDHMESKKTHLLVYTGTHDNEPIYSWYHSLSMKEQKEKRRLLKKEGYATHSFINDVLAYTLDTQADMVIIPMFDWLHLGHEARLNTPGTVGAPNWMWRMPSFSPFEREIRHIHDMNVRAGRTAGDVL